MFRRLAKRLLEMHGRQLGCGPCVISVSVRASGNVSLAHNHVKESCHGCKAHSDCCQVVRCRLYRFPYLQAGEEVKAFSDAQGRT